jgi:hypothetical protein
MIFTQLILYPLYPGGSLCLGQWYALGHLDNRLITVQRISIKEGKSMATRKFTGQCGLTRSRNTHHHQQQGLWLAKVVGGISR